MSKPTIDVGIHVEADTHIGAADHSVAGLRRFVVVKVGEADSTHGVVIYLSSHEDAMRLVKAAEQAASYLLTTAVREYEPGDRVRIVGNKEGRRGVRHFLPVGSTATVTDRRASGRSYEVKGVDQWGMELIQIVPAEHLAPTDVAVA